MNKRTGKVVYASRKKQATVSLKQNATDNQVSSASIHAIKRTFASGDSALDVPHSHLVCKNPSAFRYNQVVVVTSEVVQVSIS